MSDERTYPYTAWTLLPSFRPKKLTIVGRAYDHSYDEFDKADGGKVYHHQRDLFPSLAVAIAAGHARLVLLEATIAKQQATIAKRRAELDRAAGSQEAK